MQRQRFGYVGGTDGYGHHVWWGVPVLGRVVSDSASAFADPMVEAAHFRARVEARVNKRGNGLTEDEVAELLDEVDQLLLASPPSTYQGALSALDILSEQMDALYPDPTWRALLNGALKVLRVSA